MCEHVFARNFVVCDRILTQIYALETSCKDLSKETNCKTTVKTKETASKSVFVDFCVRYPA